MQYQIGDIVKATQRLVSEDPNSDMEVPLGTLGEVRRRSDVDYYNPDVTFVDGDGPREGDPDCYVVWWGDVTCDTHISEMRLISRRNPPVSEA